jgi:hypothetical protein
MRFSRHPRTIERDLSPSAARLSAAEAHIAELLEVIHEDHALLAQPFGRADFRCHCVYCESNAKEQ